MLSFLAPFRLYIMAAALVLTFSAGVMVTRWFYKAGEVKAWQFQVDSLKTQADKDRVKIAEQNATMARIETDATNWRRKWKQTQRDPVVIDWSNQHHPAAVGDILRDSGSQLSSDGNP